MLNCSASLAMSTCVLKALPGKLDIKRYSPSILSIWHRSTMFQRGAPIAQLKEHLNLDCKVAGLVGNRESW